MTMPEVHYAEGPEGFVTYQVIGDGPPLMLVDHWGASFELLWDLPLGQQLLRRLASFSQLILFDKRGTGSSDPLRSPFGSEGSAVIPLFEDAVADMVTVLDELQIDHVTPLGTSYGCSAAIPFAAMKPDRTSGLVLFDPCVCLPDDEDYPLGISLEGTQAVASFIRHSYGTGAALGFWAPSLRSDPDVRAWLARYERFSNSRGVLARWWDGLEFDLRPLLPLIQAPALVFDHQRPPLPGDFHATGTADYIAKAVPGTVGSHTIPTPDVPLWAPQPAAVWDQVEAFVTRDDGRRMTSTDRVFAVVLITDFVGSTPLAARLGDKRWRELLEVHDSTATRAIEQARGRLVKLTGDGLVATFDGPARATQCAMSILQRLKPVGLEIRAGVHAGEIELRGDDIGGIAVHIAARVMSLADGGQVIVSRTVKDLVAGSGLVFEDRGTHQLKGVPDEWQLYAVIE